MIVFSILVIMLAVLLITGGLVLLILGIITKKPGQWIPGAVMTGLALIIGITAVISGSSQIVKLFNTYPSEKVSVTYTSQDSDAGNDNYTESDNKLKEDCDEPVSGFIEDADNSQIYITIHPEKTLNENGIRLIKVEKCPAKSDGRMGALLHFSVEKEFNNKLVLLAFSDKDDELASSEILLKTERSPDKRLEFVFSKDTPVLEIDYFIIQIRR